MCDLERIATQAGRWDVVAVSRVTAGTIGSAVVAWGEMYLNSKNRSIPPDFVLSFRARLPQNEFVAKVTSKIHSQINDPQRQFLLIFPKKFWISGPKSGKFCHSVRFRTAYGPQSTAEISSGRGTQVCPLQDSLGLKSSGLTLCESPLDGRR